MKSFLTSDCYTDYIIVIGFIIALYSLEFHLNVSMR